MKSLFFILPALLLGLTACGAPVAAVTLPDTVQVEKTQTAETAVLYEDADGREVSPRRAALTEWRWSVADDTIAEVDPSGIVTGLRGGSTTLTLQSADGKISASCPVQVSSPLRGIALDDYTLYFDDELVTWITADGTRESDYAYASRVGAVCHLLPEDTTDHPAVTYHIADERIARFDLFDLQHRLPRRLLQLPYDLLNRINRRRLLRQNEALTTSIRMDDYRIAPAAEGCFDLFFIATK